MELRKLLRRTDYTKTCICGKLLYGYSLEKNFRLVYFEDENGTKNAVYLAGKDEWYCRQCAKALYLEDNTVIRKRPIVQFEFNFY